MAQKKEPWGWSTHGRADLPPSLRDTPSPIAEYDKARHGWSEQDVSDRQRSEAESRRATDQGSLMVKLDKPFPELKPSNNNARNVIRDSFNQRWQAEKDRTDRQPDAFDRIDQKKVEREAQTQQQGQRNLGLER